MLLFLHHQRVGGGHLRRLLRLEEEEEGEHPVLESVEGVHCGVRVVYWIVRMKRGEGRIAIVLSWLDLGVGNRR